MFFHSCHFSKINILSITRHVAVIMAFYCILSVIKYSPVKQIKYLITHKYFKRLQMSNDA